MGAFVLVLAGAFVLVLAGTLLFRPNSHQPNKHIVGDGRGAGRTHVHLFSQRYHVGSVTSEQEVVKLITRIVATGLQAAREVDITQCAGGGDPHIGVLVAHTAARLAHTLDQDPAQFIAYLRVVHTSKGSGDLLAPVSVRLAVGAQPEHAGVEEFVT